jgi:hypothetical protein
MKEIRYDSKTGKFEEIELKPLKGSCAAMSAKDIKLMEERIKHENAVKKAVQDLISSQNSKAKHGLIKNSFVCKKMKSTFEIIKDFFENIFE